MSKCNGDYLTLACHFCEWSIEKRVACGEQLAPSEQARWYERMAAHLRKHHVRKRAAQEQTGEVR